MTKVGGVEVLEMRKIPKPEIKRGTELLVKLKACGVNPIDTKLRKQGTYYPDRLPAVLGCDGAGVVEATGTNVRRFKLGDEVYFCNGGIGGHNGNYTEYTVIDERFSAHKPKKVSFVEAAGAPLILITAWESLFERSDLKKGDTVLIHAGAEGVGHVAVQLAKIKGASICATVGSSEKAEFVKKLGADKVIMYKEKDFVQDVLEWTNGIGVKLAVDTVGGETFSKTISAVCFYGDLVTLLMPNMEKTNWKEARLKNLRIIYEFMLSPMFYGLVKEQEHQAEILEQCSQLIDKRQLTIHISKTFPLKDAALAHQLIEKGGVTGKIVLVIDE